MPSSDSGENRPSRKAMMGPLMTNHKSGEPLPCPRCDSTHTKFCYYNNYNLSQPRYFCKGCRRYWTHGGALRNVPIGGGSRKNSKRSSRSSSSSSQTVASAAAAAAAAATTSSTSSSSTITSASALVHDNQSESVPAPVSANVEGLSVLKATDLSGEFNLEGNVLHVKESGNFLSLLNSHDHGVMGLGGYGTGFGYFPKGLGLGGRGIWPYLSGADDGGGNAGAVCGGSSGYNAWQFADVEGDGTGGLVDGDYITWPGLAISAPGKGLK